MELRIQYAKTADGLNIAYWAAGEGPPLVLVPPMPFNHCQRTMEFPEMRSWVERIGQGRTLVSFDTRGTGLSDRDISNLSAESLSSDMDAVVNKLGLETFSMFTAPTSGWLGIYYAGVHPERVARLALWCTVDSASGFLTSPIGRALETLRDADWLSYTETVAHFAFRWEWGEPAHRFAEYLRAATTPEVLDAYNELWTAIDMRALLGNVRCPTLVMHREGTEFPNMDDARALASGIPDAEMAVLPGNTIAPYLGDVDSLVEALDGFLGRGGKRSTVSLELAPASGTAIILFADIVDSTALTERLGDDAFRDKARGLDEAMRTAIRTNGGTPVEGKTLGDGVLAVFTSARQAISCAQACHESSSASGLALHVGIHAGDVIREANNVYGGAVNIAARVAAASVAGETLVSATVRDLARTSAGVTFEDRGEQSLKGIDDPVRVFAVRQA